MKKILIIIFLCVIPYPVSATHEYLLGIKISEGPEFFVVTELDPSGIGAQSGLKVGDHILVYNGHKFTTGTLQEWYDVFKQASKNHLTAMRVMRSGQELTLTIDVRTKEELDLAKKETDNKSVPHSFPKEIQAYEGRVTWDGGEALVTTTIFQQGDTLSGTTKYQDGSEGTMTLSGSDPSKRVLFFKWEEKSFGISSLTFSPSYDSFEGTWGYENSYDNGGIWTGRVEGETEIKEQAQQTTINAETTLTGSVPYYYYNTDFSVTEDGYGNSIPVGHLADSQEICSIIKHSIFQRMLEAQAQFEQQFYFLESDSLLAVLKKTIEMEWKFLNTLYVYSPNPPNYTKKAKGDTLKYWIIDKFEKQELRDIDSGGGGSSLLSIQEMSKSNIRMWKGWGKEPPEDTIFLENAWAECLRSIQEENPALLQILFQRNVFSGWISSHCLEGKKRKETVIQSDGTIVEKTIYEQSERGCAHPRYGGVLNNADGLLFFLTSHREGHKWLRPMLDYFEKNLEQQIVVAGEKIKEEKKLQEDAQVQAQAQAEEAEKPENQLASAYISYLRTKACYEARQGYAMVFLNDQEMEMAKNQIKSIEKAISSQHKIDIDSIWTFAVNNMSPLGGLEQIAGGLKEYLALEAQGDFEGTRNFCYLWKMPLTHLANKWTSDPTDETKKDF